MQTMTNLMEQAWAVRAANWPSRITFDYPSQTLPVSVTGTACALNCAHCGSHYLRHMVPIQEASSDRRLDGASSLLISGGCDLDGRVPVMSHLPAIASLRSGRRLNWHVGLLDDAELEAIRPLVDVVSFDFVGDDDTIREVYGLNQRVSDYAASYQRLRASVPVVPHVTVGLHAGQLRGERTALRLLRELGMEMLVFLVFTPTAGTRYAGCQPPALDQVIELLAEARVLLPHTTLSLGCMRPGGEYRAQLDTLAVRLGMNRIVNPVAAAVHAATELGLNIVESHECCVF